MTHSFRVHYFHLIWSTKNRTPWIEGEMQERLYPYLGGIIKNHKGKLIEIGGMPGHIHIPRAPVQGYRPSLTHGAFILSIATAMIYNFNIFSQVNNDCTIH